MFKVSFNFKWNTILKGVKNVGEEDDTKIDLETVWYRILQKLKPKKREKDEVQHTKYKDSVIGKNCEQKILHEFSNRPPSGKANTKWETRQRGEGKGQELKIELLAKALK